jgi:hypothetical protein
MLVMLTLLLPVALGFVAMTIDVGLAFVERGQLQNAVDAAALAAAQDFANGESEDTATATAIDYLQRNGYDNVDGTIEVNIPPTGGTFAGLDGYVEVTASADAPMAFLALFMDGPFTPKVRSVAEGAEPTLGSVFYGGTLPPPAPVPAAIECGNPDVDGRVTDSDGYTKLGDLGVGATDYGDVFVTCDTDSYFFAMRLNGPDTGGPVANDNAYGGCKNGEVKYKNGAFDKLKGTVASVDVPGSRFTVDVLGDVWTVDVDGGTNFKDGLGSIADLTVGMGVEVKGAEVGWQQVLASEVRLMKDRYCTAAEPDYHVTYDTGWQYVGQGHTYEKLLKSDRARFQIACGDTTVHDFILDYLRETGTSWASDVSGDGTVYLGAPTASASSLEWNLEHPAETGWGDDPGEDMLEQSPPFNPTWPTYDAEYDGWIWEMIYEFKVPKQPLDDCAGTVSFGLYDFSGSTGGLVGIHSSPSKTADGANVVIQGQDSIIRLVE